MTEFHPKLAPFPKPEHPEATKLTVICHLCGDDFPVGIIDTETIALPLKGHMFESYAPERGVDPFFAPEADWENMWCKWGIPNAVDGHHPFPPTNVLTKEQGWYEPKGSSELIMCPICKVDGVDSILQPCLDKPGFAICPIHDERKFDLAEPIILPTEPDTRISPNPMEKGRKLTLNYDLTDFMCQHTDKNGKICGKQCKSQKALSGHMKAHRKGKEAKNGSKRTGRKTANHSN